MDNVSAADFAFGSFHDHPSGTYLMTAYVVFVATLFSMWMIRMRGLEAAFLKSWMPFFLMLPFSFFVDIPGLPDPNFMQAAILPILFVLLVTRKDEMRAGLMEALIACYLVLRVVMDYQSRGYADAQNYAFYLFSSLLGPYLLGRYIINRREMDIATARQFVLIFIVLFPIFIYELVFWISPIYKLMLPLFPSSTPAMSLRYGMARTFGPFEHPILACVMIVAVYRLHRWLSWKGEWDKPQGGWLGWLDAKTRWTRIPLKYKISVALIAMAIMTISRGPWIGGFAGATLTAAGNFRNRKRWLWIAFVLLILGAGGGKMALDAYVTPAVGEAISGEAQTMLYRKELVERYKDYMYEKMWTGWGLNTRPKIKGMESVDNAYLGMALQHGILAPILFVFIFIYAIASQIRFGLRALPGEPPIGFTFAGIYLAAFVSFATVYMGSQTEPMLFLLLGWGESIKHRRPEKQDVFQTPSLPSAALPFRKILY
jgi:hypothetical protein